MLCTQSCNGLTEVCSLLSFFLCLVGRLKTETGTLITIPPDEANSDVIRIEGSPEGVAKAKAHLVELAQRMVSHCLNDSHS